MTPEPICCCAWCGHGPISLEAAQAHTMRCPQNPLVRLVVDYLVAHDRVASCADAALTEAVAVREAALADLRGAVMR